MKKLLLYSGVSLLLVLLCTGTIYIACLDVLQLKCKALSAKKENKATQLVVSLKIYNARLDKKEIKINNCLYEIVSAVATRDSVKLQVVRDFEEESVLASITSFFDAQSLPVFDQAQLHFGSVHFHYSDNSKNLVAIMRLAILPPVTFSKTFFHYFSADLVARQVETDLQPPEQFQFA